MLTRREEAKGCPRVALNAVASREDEAVLAEIAPSARYPIVPNGVDTSQFVPCEPGPRRGIVSSGERPGSQISTRTVAVKLYDWEVVGRTCSRPMTRS